MLYFAYGSNMNHRQMKERCPNAHFLRRAYLEDYKFVYDGWSKNRKSPVANVILTKGSKTWGGLFDISDGDLVTLDHCEGYPTAYERAKLNIKDDKNNLYKAIVYFRTGKELGKPSKEYRQTITQGARDCSLPEEYTQSFL